MVLLVNAHMHKFLEDYGIDYVKSGPYYPQGNGQAEATNKILLCILSTMIYKEPKRWKDFLSFVFGHIVPQSPFPSTHAFLRSLCRRAIEVMVP